MKGLRAYLELRLTLLWRLLREIGWLRLAVLLPMALAVLGRAVVLAAGHARGQWAVPVLVAAQVAAMHRRRADLRFLASSAPGFRQWLATEYALAAMPVAVVLGAFHDWTAALLTLVLPPLAALLPPARNKQPTQHRSRSLFRSEAVEWVSGLRLGGQWAWPLLLAGAVWQASSPLGPGAALVVWLLVLLACYGTPSPSPCWCWWPTSPARFCVGG